VVLFILSGLDQTVTVYTQLSTELEKLYVLPPPSCLWVATYGNRTGYFLCLASLNSADPKDATWLQNCFVSQQVLYPTHISN